MLPSDLPALLRAAGLTVEVIDGWRGRGLPGPFGPVGVLNHHTGASAKGWTRAKERSYALWMFVTGRSDLSAPLCQIALGRSGVVYLGAAGRANHAGRAKSSGTVAAGDGNRLYIGIEWMLSGTEPIPAEMMKAGITLNAVLTEKVTKTSVKTISAHYQTSVTGKWDIGDPKGVDFRGAKVLDVDAFRNKVATERTRLYHQKVQTTPSGRKHRTWAISWNVKTGRKASVVRRELKNLLRINKYPAVVALQEVRGYRAMLRLLAPSLRYRIYQPKDAGPKPKGVQSREAGSTALMLRRYVKVRERGVLRLTKTWKGPKHGRVHEGRVIPWAVAWIEGRWTLVVPVHGPTGKFSEDNAGAWDEFIESIEALVERKNLPFILIGDWNDRYTNRGVRSVRAMADRLGGQIVHTSAPVDYAAIGGHRMVLKKKSRRGSDHPAIALNRK